ncbi:MAG: HAMP domain-containing histidine kinase [Myxococcota bacterium]|nr:HAMP domain-containing histidine kinase [Myxococcota bacterium]
MNAAARLVSRLVTVQLVTWATTGLLVMAFAPRLLLLDTTAVGSRTPLALVGWLAALMVPVAATLLVTRRVRPLLRELSLGGTSLDPTGVQALYAVPARLVGLDLAAILMLGVLTLAPPLRFVVNDLPTQVELVLLALTMASVGGLFAYVTMRAAVTRAMELVPMAASREAIERLDPHRMRVARLRHRLLAAVVAPVAFVALGASLLVHAHLRAFDAACRVDEASALAEGIFDGPPRDSSGVQAAAESARAHGFDVRLEPGTESFRASHDDAGRTVLTVPLAERHAVVLFRTVVASADVGAYFALSVVAIAIAALLGWRIGRAFAQDVALATRVLGATGVAEVIRGGRIRGDARFQSVAALMTAADELGGVFREFASAQQRAIDARTSTERMRGLFLASMSHDLKTPLNAILGFADLVSRGSLSEGQRESVSIIEQRGRELLYLIETILDSARVEAGELTVSPQSVRVGDVVMRAVLVARGLASGAHANITGEIRPGVPRIRVDPARLIQSLTAIILVATRFAERGHVVVRALAPEPWQQVRIDVVVTGLGVAGADREKIFDAFKHADRARRHGSLGLGPSLARAIVELHGGRVDVATTDSGGTVFHVWVPTDKLRPQRR